MRIFGIGGLGADKRVFEYLTLNRELIPIEWIKPQKDEHIEDFSKRLISKYQLDKEDDIGILGVSFGGLVATEISKIINPRLTILISSAETRSELGLLIKLAGKLKIINLIPKQILNPPKSIAHFMFGTDNKELLNLILDDTDLDFLKWALKELVNWKNETQLNNVIKIGGTNDKLLPPKDNSTILIEKGEHFMIVDKAQEISEIINDRIRCINMDAEKTKF